MLIRKLFDRLLVILILASLVLGSVPVLAQGQGNGKGPDYQKKAAQWKERKKKRITPADRQAAAQRAAAAGFALPEMGAAMMAMPGTAPRYFSHPNYANSPLRLPDALIELVGGDGTGATATATVDPATGAITAIHVTNGGNGYTTAPEVVISTAVVTPSSPASATALLGGSVSSLTLDSGGGGYTGPIAVDLVGGGGSSAAATATGSLDVLTLTSPGAGYTAPTVSFTGDGVDAAASTAGPVDGLFLVAGGSGYVSPTVTFVGGGGTGATATATVDVSGTIVSITLVNGGDGYSSAPVIEITDAIGTGAGAVATATIAVTSIAVTNPGTGYTSAPSVVITDTGAGAGAAATATLAVTSLNLTSGGAGYTSAPAVVFTDVGGTGSGAAATATVSGSVVAVTVNDGGAGYITPGIRKFVDGLPGLGAANANNLGQYIPVAIPDTTSYPGSDYYEIAVIQYREKMHSDLPPTLLRGYVQLSTSVVPGDRVPLSNALPDGTEAPTGYFGVTAPHYLGPLISATKDRPVRILFRNLLPTGVNGDLFIPVDTTVMGSGMGPNMGGMAEMDPQNPMCGAGYDMNGNRVPKDPDCFAENRATLHLHGGISPWISDGTPHQWITPAGENTSYPKGVSVQNVPDMPDPGPGAMTFFYTNQQSARLMFYHDHSWGITRLNVYAGEAAGYLITDPTEQSLVSQGIIPAEQIPLVIQDKTFVPDTWQLAMQDETWDMTRWGGLGNLWLPHVYSPAQNPGDSSGVNQFGRWAYGPWFWPPTLNIDHGPIANPYYDPNCNPDVQWCEPPLMPGTPFNSMGMEAFHDTPVVNGTAYPTVELQPKSYRLRILNAANDRFFNLSLYEADASGTEVALNPAEVAAALLDPPGVFPTPVAPPGPSWIQIGTEGGFLPAPVVIPPQPITWVTDPTVFNAGNVDQHSLLLGPAERADVIVDLSAFAGKTLILYNDAPAAFPARDPRYDYYTGNADLQDTGGAPSTLPGYGPNTRTIMQIKVAAAPPAPAFNLSALETAFKAESLGGQGVFQKSQHPIIVGQGAYNSAYGTSFATNGPSDGFARITDFSMTFNTLSGVQMVNFPFQPKAIQDEMGESFDKDYGRMSGNLGLEVPLTQAGVAQNLILYPYVNPASELIDATLLPKADTAVTPISVANDGTQIWKITHNGVDTHPIHFHLFDVQLVNRVGWDGIIRPPDANELGWKDTLRISPLEDTIVALRPIIPVVPFDLPNSVRPLNPMMPLGSTLMFNSTDANANPTAPIVNELVNFGWEYVWHCHILSHEEMDMMRPISVAAPPKAPALSAQTTGNGNNRRVVLTWADNSINETSFVVQKALTATGPWTDLATLPANATTYTDPIGNTTQTFYYRVIVANLVGYTGTPGYSTLTVTSASNTVEVGPPPPPPPAAPTNLTAVVQAGPQVLLTWRDNANNETGFVIERAVNGGAFAALITIGPRNGTGNVSYTDVAVVAGNTYSYQVAAANAGGLSGYSNTATVTLPAPPAAPSNVVATAVIQGNNAARVTLIWVDNANNETGFVIQRATNAAFTANLVTSTVGPNVTTFTTGNVARNTPYYFRIQAVNGAGPSAWVNATPFPIITP